MNIKIKSVFLLLFLTVVSNAQQGIAVYSDYLSDNYYLLHPSMAGAANCAKIRLTARKQWFGIPNAPEMQTLSFNARVGEKSGLGVIAFNDVNGNHSQKGVKGTYAYHLMFSRDEIDLNQLSFGISAGLIQAQLDETGFNNGGSFDPIISGTVQKDSYYNFDAGLSYNFLDFYAHATVKNLFETRREIYTGFETDNLRKYLLSAGFILGDREQILWEPSIMFQYTEKTKENSIDLNVKLYKELEFGKLWGGVSFRTPIDEIKNDANNQNDIQKWGYITPILGINYGKYMFAYTYTYLSTLESVNFDTSGFHQITLGINLFCKRERYECNCPGVN